MAIGTSTGLGSAPADGASLLPVPDAAGRRMRLQLPRSPKVLIGLAMLAVFLIVAVIGPWIAPYNPSRSFSATASFPQAPSAAHWLGTTQQQQDVLSQLLAGGRSTVLVAFVAGLVATVLSIVIGVTAGYAGRLTDDLLSMLANFFLVLPALPLLIVIFGFLKTAQGGHDLLIGLVIAITGWAWGARVLRAQTLSLRNRDYVESARIVGERGWRIIGFEILPNLTPIVASSFLFTVLYGVGTYTALAFLGLVNPNHWSWGGMLFYAQVAGAEQSGYWWWFIPPGIAVALLGTSLALINFGIDEFINPRLRVAGLSRRRARRAGVSGLPKRFVLGVTPVVRQDLAAAADGTPGWGPGGRAPGGRAPGGRAPGGPAPGAGSADLISASGHAKSRRWRRGGGQ
jgi:peptide/nickel transport system permease protein